MRQARDALVAPGSKLMAWIDKHVPYKTGAMHDALVNTLQASTLGVIKVGVRGINYAGYVDSFTPTIHWTKPRSQYHFFEKVLGMVEVLYEKLLRKFLKIEQAHLLARMALSTMLARMIG